LLIAEHTHGGHVQIGPILTFSQVPRSWTDGLTVILDKKTLTVSRGVSMGRKHALRVRFFASPELTVINVAPK
jgi:predicted MPP superfamily phosphohydrolase